MTLESSIPRFASELLTRLGAEVAPDGADRVTVELPPEWAARFGHRQVLNFAFTPEAVLSPGQSELVIPGSFWLDRLLEIAQERGEIGTLRLAPRLEAAELKSVPPKEMAFHNASARTRSGTVFDRHHLLVSLSGMVETPRL